MEKPQMRPLSERPSAIVFTEPTLTKQSFRDECDINNVMKQFERTGVIDGNNNLHPTYGDFSNVDDYHEAQIKIARATESFDALPVRIRVRFNHDPADLVDFMSDPKNAEEAKDLGLIVVTDPEESKRLRIDPEPAAEPSPTAGTPPPAGGDSGS